MSSTQKSKPGPPQAAWGPRWGILLARLGMLVLLCGLPAFLIAGDATNVIIPPLSVAGPAPAPESFAWSIFRVFGALLVVLGVFFGFVWLFRNWQRVLVRQGRSPRLNVLEIRSLGSRQSICVVGYDQQRFLVATSPTGVTFLANLPAATGTETPAPTFTDALQVALSGKR